MTTSNDLSERVQVEIAVLEKYGLRWAVLAAWCDDLRGRGIALPGAATRKLEESRVKISSGCFSSCSVGCDLGAVEATLVSTATSGAAEVAESTDFWLELLAHAMSGSAAAERLLRIPAVRVNYARCGFGPCSCGQ